MGRQVFEMSEVATIVGLNPSTVKNWTIGRPLRIAPSIRIADGRGRSNLYSLGDAYRFALANELQQAGITPKHIGEILGKLAGEDLAEIVWLKIWRIGRDLMISKDNANPPAGAKAWMVVDLPLIVHEIDEKLR
jgi:hypothetical protein